MKTEDHHNQMQLLEEELFNPHLFNDALSNNEISDPLYDQMDSVNLKLNIEEMDYTDFMHMRNLSDSNS